MRPFSRLERKGVCLGLLWGILSIAPWPQAGVVASWLRFPYVVGESLWRRYAWPAPERFAYVAAILLATVLTYSITYLLYLGRRGRLRKYRRSKGRARRY